MKKKMIYVPMRELEVILRRARRDRCVMINLTAAHESFENWRWWWHRRKTAEYKQLLAAIGAPTLTFRRYMEDKGTCDFMMRDLKGPDPKRKGNGNRRKWGKR